ncbi:MAG: adenylate/guanylate cyclase domain-containing protein [Pseudomonadota bacterium]
MHSEHIKTPTNSEARLQKAEDNGLRLAIFCRTLAAGLAFTWYISAVVFLGQELRAWPLIAFLLFILIGVAHLGVIGTRHNRWWMKYVLYAFDILTICALFAIIPVSRVEEVPQIIAFRAYGIYYLFPIVALATLSLSWRLTLWAGVIVTIGWWGAFLWVTADMHSPLSWADMPAPATRADYETIFLSIDFVGRGNRLEETGLLMIGASILAVAVYRARQLFFAQMVAEEKRHEERLKRQRIADSFGQYVPDVMVDQLVESGGKLPLRQAEGSILVLDIESFSTFLASRTPDEAIRTVDAFLSAAADEIGKCKGTVISYTGDGLLASFNAPIETHESEIEAVGAAASLLDIAREHGFRIRLGICAGELISGSIGSRHHMAFTVYGAAVNRAARCEALCKDLIVPVLMDARIAGKVRKTHRTKSVGEHTLRGFSEPEELFTLKPLNDG